MNSATNAIQRAGMVLGDVVDQLHDATVIPTPTPPKSPTFPPRLYYVDSSTTAAEPTRVNPELSVLTN